MTTWTRTVTVNDVQALLSPDAQQLKEPRQTHTFLTADYLGMALSPEQARIRRSLCALTKLGQLAKTTVRFETVVFETCTRRKAGTLAELCCLTLQQPPSKAVLYRTLRGGRGRSGVLCWRGCDDGWQ